MGRKRKFREFKIPRYLPGSVPRAKWFGDLREYNKLRYNCFTVKKRVDDNPPKLNPYHYIDKSKILKDQTRLLEIEKENRQLLIKINSINRTKGVIDSYNPVAYQDNTKWRKHELAMLAIEKYNVNFYDRIKKAQSQYRVQDMNKFWENVLEKMKYSCKYPVFFLKKKITLDDMVRAQPSISEGLGKTADRPYCFLEFKIKDSAYLGKIIIELYHDHVPVTVQNFLSICKGENGLTYKNCLIHNIVRGQYVETGDITLGNGKGGMSIYGKTFDEENFALKHTRTGVLSTIRVKENQNNSQFSITLTKVEKLDDKRVVFGKVVKGNATLFNIADLQTRKVGKPSIPIMISNCGEYVPKKKN